VRRKVLGIVLIVFAFTSRAQYYNDDASLWLNLAGTKELNAKTELQVSMQNRIGNNVTQYNQGSIDVGLQYKVNKLFRISGDYMLRQSRRLDGSYSTRHRFYLNLFLRKKAGSFTFIYRNRTQMQLKDVYSSEEGSVPVFYNRNKLQVKYELNKRIELYVSEEVYSPFYNFNQIGIDRTRSSAGMIYNLSKKSSLEGTFYYQQELYATRQLRRNFIYSLTYNFTF